MKVISPVILILCLCVTNPGVIHQRGVFINFDKTADGRELIVPLTSHLQANNYLASFDIMLSDVTQGTQVVIRDARSFYDGNAIDAELSQNVLTQIGSNDPVSFTMNFKRPFHEVGFMRPTLLAGPNGITFPLWKATALDAQGRTIASCGESLGRYNSDADAKYCVLRGAGIKAVRFDSNNQHFAAFSAVVITHMSMN